MQTLIQAATQVEAVVPAVEAASEPIKPTLVMCLREHGLMKDDKMVKKYTKNVDALVAVASKMNCTAEALLKEITALNRSAKKEYSNEIKMGLGKLIQKAVNNELQAVEKEIELNGRALPLTWLKHNKIDVEGYDSEQLSTHYRFVLRNYLKVLKNEEFSKTHAKPMAIELIEHGLPVRLMLIGQKTASKIMTWRKKNLTIGGLIGTDCFLDYQEAIQRQKTPKVEKEEEEEELTLDEEQVPDLVQPTLEEEEQVSDLVQTTMEEEEQAPEQEEQAEQAPEQEEQAEQAPEQEEQAEQAPEHAFSHVFSPPSTPLFDDTPMEEIKPKTRKRVAEVQVQSPSKRETRSQKVKVAKKAQVAKKTKRAH